MADTQVTIHRAKRAFSVATLWRDMYQDAYRYALPMRNLYETTTPGAKKMNRVFDSTAINSTVNFVSSIQSDVFPPFREWLELVPGTDIPEERHDEGRSVLEVVQKKFFSVVHRSNFDTAIGEWLCDLAVGTAAMLTLEGDDNDPLVCVPVPVAQLALDEGPNGSVDGIFRSHVMAPRNIERTWPDLTPAGKVAVEKMLKKSLNPKTDNPDSNTILLEATYFDEGKYRYQVIDTGADTMATVTFPADTNNTEGSSDATVLVEREYDDNPWMITRWMKAAGEVFGRGPLLYALPDIKTLNKTKEFLLQNASMSISGMWKVHSDNAANLKMIRLKSGAFFPVDDMDNLERLDNPSDLGLTKLLLDDLKMSVQTSLYDQALPDPSGPVRSPTEIIERLRLRSQTIGSPFSRIYSDFVVPFAQRVLNIMGNKGMIDFPIRVDGRAVKVSATSPLAKEQSLNDLENVVNWLALNQQFGPELVAGTIKIEDIADYSADKLGVPQKLVREEAEKGQMAEMVANIVANQQQQAQQPAVPQ